MFIGSVDVPETKRLKKLQMRKEQNTIRSSKQASAASASNYYSVENEGETEIEDAMEVKTAEDQEGTKDGPYTTFASKSFQQPTLTVQMDGAGHLWHFINSSRYLPEKYRDIIKQVISRNAYFAAPENLLLAMLTDNRCHIRTLAAWRIIKAREIGPGGNCVRRFVIPAVDFRATDYVDLIDWQA
ncbi:hypothetical protein AVEN_209041-1 [Araneus ventricosus]|uniref:Uncharacterized protein n=1 Tax=Araneus ventricosus TaxID=182803 RepID=A0A4Y2KLJ8_ARAVE|nr:hypothetical protein AVEN_209041-1 [Araneus ventricosus]